MTPRGWKMVLALAAVEVTPGYLKWLEEQTAG